MRALFAFLEVFVKIVTSPIFLILLLAAVVVWLIVTWYRSGKLRALGELQYSRSFSCDGVFAGETFEFTEEIYNPTFFPLFSVKMQFYVPAGFTIDEVVCTKYTEITSLFHIPPRATVTKQHVVRADIRDHYQLKTAMVRYRGSEFLFSVPFDIYVYPNYMDVKANIPSGLYQAGNRVAERKYIEDPFFLSGIRPYMFGDPMRSINFKASVRSFSGGMRQMMSNSYNTSRNFDAMIFLDLFDYAESNMQAEQPDKKEEVEIGLQYACYLLVETLRQGGSVGFACNCEVDGKAYLRISCGATNAHIKTILEALAKVKYYARREYSISALMANTAKELASGTDVYLITTYVDSRAAEVIHMLENMGCNVCVIPLSKGGGYR